MPNCCYGTLQITSSEECMKVIVELISGTADDGTPMFDFAKVISISDSVSDEYEWRYENWGTPKAGFDLAFYDDCLSFWTAWCPCSPVIAKLAEMFPDASFDYRYDESGDGFCGEEKYERGCKQEQLSRHQQFGVYQKTAGNHSNPQSGRGTGTV